MFGVFFARAHYHADHPVRIRRVFGGGRTQTASANIRASAAMRIMMDSEWPQVRSYRRPLFLAARVCGHVSRSKGHSRPVGALAGLTSLRPSCACCIRSRIAATSGRPAPCLRP